MNTLSVGDVFDQAWQLTKRHGLLLAVFLFVLSIVTSGVQFPFYPSGYWEAVFSGNVDRIARMEEMNASFNFGTGISFIIAVVAQLGFLVTLLRLARGNNRSLDFSSFAAPLVTYLKYVASSLLLGLIVAVGLVLCVLPGIYLAIRLGFAPLRILDRPETEIIESLRYSWDITKGHEMSIFLLGIVGFVVALAGILLCCIGYYYTAVISEFAFVITYLILTGDSFGNAPAPSAETPYDTSRY